MCMVTNRTDSTQYKCVHIVWKDAFASPQGWFTLDELTLEPALPETIGWLLPPLLEGYISTADSVLIHDGEAIFYNVGHIPEDMVLSIKELDIKQTENVLVEPKKKTTGLLKKGK